MPQRNTLKASGCSTTSATPAVSGSMPSRAGAKKVVNVDLSQNALDIARPERRTERSRCQQHTSSCVTTSLQALARISREGRKFDVIVLDPPKFAEDSQLLAPAAATRTSTCWRFQLLAGWRALDLPCLRPDGVSLFQKIVADAALDVRSRCSRSWSCSPRHLITPSVPPVRKASTSRGWWCAPAGPQTSAAPVPGSSSGPGLGSADQSPRS